MSLEYASVMKHVINSKIIYMTYILNMSIECSLMKYFAGKEMIKMIVGYARVSTTEQNPERQIRMFEEKYKVDKTFLDKLSGKNTNRPELKAMLEYVREGDTLVVESYSRLARSTKDLLAIVDQLQKKNVFLISDKENIDTSTPTGKLFLTIIAGLSEFERECILQRQREGIEIAKQEGKYKGRQPLPFDEKKFISECSKWRKGEQTAVETMRKLDMKPNRFYRKVQKLGV